VSPVTLVNHQPRYVANLFDLPVPGLLLDVDRDVADDFFIHDGDEAGAGIRVEEAREIIENIAVL